MKVIGLENSPVPLLVSATVDTGISTVEVEERKLKPVDGNLIYRALIRELSTVLAMILTLPTLSTPIASPDDELPTGTQACSPSIRIGCPRIDPLTL